MRQLVGDPGQESPTITSTSWDATAWSSLGESSNIMAPPETMAGAQLTKDRSWDLHRPAAPPVDHPVRRTLPLDLRGAWLVHLPGESGVAIG